MKVLDLFAGHGGFSAAWKDRGHEVFRVEKDSYYKPDLVLDVQRLSVSDLPWRPDVILASPPCQKFSIMSVTRNWNLGYVPAHDATREAIALVRRTVHLIHLCDPPVWVIENPRNILRKLNLIPGERVTVTQCQYGRPFMKPTDLWGGYPPGWKPKTACRNGDPCHEAAPKGSHRGVRSVDYDIRSTLPYDLSLSLCLAAESADRKREKG